MNSVAISMQRLTVCIFGASALWCAMPPAKASCGSAVCMVNTNWELQGVAMTPGWRLDTHFDYVRQNRLKSGGDTVAVGQVRRHHDEVSTTNRNLVATLDYTHDAQWGVAVTLPQVDRAHEHIHNHGGGQISERWDFARTGDVRVVGRYQLQPDRAAITGSYSGINFGLKLPTGARNLRNADGDLAERTLQPGTGTTDLILGGYWGGAPLYGDHSWFAQTLWQAPLAARDEYRPGRRIAADLGYRYEAGARVGLMMQLNALYKGHDSGAQAEPGDSGGRFLFLSPGASIAVTRDLQVYGFVHIPVYQHVNGVQLVARHAFLAGVSMKF